CLARPRWFHVHASVTVRALGRPEEAASVKAIAIHATGDVDVLQIEDVERPEPSEGEVLIRVHAAAVNPVDWKYRRGIADRPLPAVLGEEVSGTVELSRAEEFARGDEVFGISISGGFSGDAPPPAAASPT